MSHFPETPLIQFLYWILNTPGVGAVFVGLLGVGLVLLFGRVLHWIADGAKAHETPVYIYPTEALHHHTD